VRCPRALSSVSMFRVWALCGSLRNRSSVSRRIPRGTARAGLYRRPDDCSRSAAVRAGRGRRLVELGCEHARHAAALARYVDRIIKGAKPEDLPVQQLVKFELGVNLKAAKALGLAIPTSILLRADEVVE